MPYAFKVTVTSKSGERATQSGQFTDDEWALLRRFARFCEQLSETGLIKNKRRISYSVRWRQEEGEKQDATIPPDDEVSAFLHRMRPFILESETTYLPRVLNVLARRVTLPQARPILDFQRKRFLRQLDGDLRISTGDAELTSDELLKKWLNAFEYHRDEEKQQELEAVTVAFPGASGKAIFLISLFDKAQSVFDTASLVQALEKRGEAETIM